MGFLALVIRETPQEMANEREQFAEVLARSMESMQAAHRANMKYHQQLEERLTQLPAEIAKGISAEAIAAKLGESLRQQFQETGLPAVANAIGAQATTLRHTSKELSAVLSEFSHPRTGAAPRIKEALSSMKDDLKNAADHVRVQMNRLGKELWQTIALLCGGVLVLGMLVGMLYQRWMDTPTQPQQPPAPAVQSAPPASAPIPPNHKKRPQPSPPQ